MHSQTVYVCVCVCTTSFIKPRENMFPSLLNIDAWGGIKQVNKSWNTDNTTLKEVGNMWTFAICDVWMWVSKSKGERDASRKGLHNNNSGGLSKWKRYSENRKPEVDVVIPFKALRITDIE